MYHTVLYNEIRVVTNLFRFMSSSSKSHYDVLNLPRNCTDKEIKDAFIKLSKQLHPDRNKGANTHEAFVRVMEAYSVLGKPQSRAQYDFTPVYTERSWASDTHREKGWTPNSDAAGEYGRKRGPRTFYTSNMDNAEARTKMKRSHTNLAMICVGVAIVGSILQLWVIMFSSRVRQAKLDEVSKSSAEHLAKVREAALLNGNKLQTQLILERVEEGASPAAATGALADTLAHK